MTFANWLARLNVTDWLQVVATAAIIPTLIIAIKNSRATKKALMSTSMIASLSMEVEFHKLLASHVKQARNLYPHKDRMEMTEDKLTYYHMAGVLLDIFSVAAVARERDLIPEKYWREIYQPWIEKYKDVEDVKNFWVLWKGTFPTRLNEVMSSMYKTNTSEHAQPTATEETSNS